MLRLRNAFRCVRISGIQNDFYCQSVMQLSAAPPSNWHTPCHW